MKTIFSTVGNKNAIVICDTLTEYTEITNKGENTIYLIKKSAN